MLDISFFGLRGYDKDSFPVKYPEIHEKFEDTRSELRHMMI
jgi:hypothetical protein